MAKKWIGLFTVLALLLTLTLPVLAQESAVKGNIGGVVQDSTGAVVPGAKVTVTGPTGSKSLTSDNDGKFFFPVLTLGTYGVKVEKQGFRTAELKAVEVVAGKTSSLSIAMQPGSVSETVEVSAAAVTVDTTSTAVGANLNDTFYSQIPVGRNVGALFTAAPGVVSGGGTGSANPSIGGASGLENLYLADGVNITSQAFGGLGVYTQLYGSVGTGINLSFIKEVDVKTGGFEAQYGQANGGIVQIVTKSGSSQFHGGVSLYAAPNWARATALYPDDFRQSSLVGRLFDRQSYEASGELGGYVPGLKDHLFFFGAFDPTWTKDTYAPPNVSTVGPTVNFNQAQRVNTYNWAGKLTFKINDANTVEGSAFGDPSHTNTGRVLGKSLNVFNNTGWSKWEYGTRNVVARYNGTLSPTWLLTGSYTHNNNDFTETPTQDIYQVVDRTTSNVSTLQGFGPLLNHKSTTWSINVDTTKVVHAIGSHSLMVGYRYERPEYIGDRIRSGGTYTVPAVNATGGSYVPTTNNLSPIGDQANAQFSLRLAPGVSKANGVYTSSCTLCPLYPVAGFPVAVPVYLRVSRGEYNLGQGINTHSEYHAAYATDNWSLNKYVTLTAGLRWEDQHMYGRDVNYAFTDNWSPRLGITIDPFGDHKSKLFFNYGRYSYPLPLDAALRQLSSELDLNNVDFAPVVSGTTVTPVLDQAHLISNAIGGTTNATSLAAGGYPIVPGTRMNYEDEFVVGGEREVKGIVISARYTDRRLKRIVEDLGSVSPEDFIIGQNSRIGNPAPTTDIFGNEKEVLFAANTAPAGFPAGCDDTNTLTNANGTSASVTDANGNVVTDQAICFLPTSTLPGRTAGDVGPDGFADGFVGPIRIYKAFEVEANKSFSRGYMFRVNYRWASLYGNYEGAFRNDNGQSDPGISSLFDFTAGQFNLLGDQFTPGMLNTDRHHVVNGFFSYTFSKSYLKGLTMGTGIRIQQGTPLNILGNHPNYGNSGEVPLNGRGTHGRSPVTGQVDLKLQYQKQVTERFTLALGADMFNIADSRRITNIDQRNALDFSPVGSNLDGPPNKPLIAPTSGFTRFQDPFYSRFSVKLTF